MHGLLCCALRFSLFFLALRQQPQIWTLEHRCVITDRRKCSNLWLVFLNVPTLDKSKWQLSFWTHLPLCFLGQFSKRHVSLLCFALQSFSTFLGMGPESPLYRSHTIYIYMFYYIVLFYIYINIYIYVILYFILYIYDPVFRPRGPPLPPEWDGSPGSTPTSLLFASYWQHFWGPASYLLGFCSDSDYQPPIY